jgi:diadenosine tetraphosphate (Ap4A) HIT family hydrolase
MTSESLVTLGSTLSLAAQTVEAVVKPDRIYCAMFGEEKNYVHFHVFPRTKQILAEYLKANPSDSKRISGPKLLHWVREEFKRDLTVDTLKHNMEETIKKLRRFMKSS